MARPEPEGGGSAPAPAPVMRLCVHVVEARGLSAAYLSGYSDPYVRLQLGRRRAKTTVVKRCLSPVWDEEFGFLVGAIAEELVVSVLNEDKYFSNDHFLGRVRFPLAAVMEAEGRSLGMAGYSDPYVRLQLGRRRAKTTVVKRCLSPVWDDGGGDAAAAAGEELVVSVLNEEGYYFSAHFLGRVRFPLAAVMEAEGRSLGMAWYQLQPKSGGFRRKRRVSGEICLRIYLSFRTQVCDESRNMAMQLINYTPSSSMRSGGTNASSLSAASVSSLDLSACPSMERASCSSMDKMNQGIMNQQCHRSADQLPCISTERSILLEPEEDNDAPTSASSVVEVMSRYFCRKPVDATPSATSDYDSIDQFQDTQMSSESCENGDNGTLPESSFNELMKSMESKDKGSEMPENLRGGILVDQSYVIPPAEMNSLLFSAHSNFWPAVAEIQGLSGFQTEPWKHVDSDICLKRTLSYTKAASKLVKSVKITEEQTYLKATGNSFAVLSSVSSPEVPCGNCFKVEILYCIIPGPQLPSKEQTSHLVISWRLNFVQSTMLKGMIESGTKQGLREGYAQFTEILSQKTKVIAPDDANLSKDEILGSLQTQEESIWKLAARFLGNFAFIFSLSVALYAIAHLRLVKPNVVHGLEYFGIDLPDSIWEVVFCAILIIQGQKIFKAGRRFLYAWKQSGSDHGVKAHGDGWLLTVALIEGSGVLGAGTPGLPDPYVVFTCNGKRKTSSVKFQTSEPKWNEIFEFDAMDDPPARLDVVMHDSDGPSKENPIGQTEVNFLKNNLSDLGDMWLPLDGRFPQGCEPKLHLRIFLNNSRGTEIVMNYLAKMGKEVGKKMHLRSAQTNSAFRKLFSLPPEEFLIDDFTCYLKRKMPLQGRIFLSPRILGFYSNILGRKTKFFFLWDDIDDIQVAPPTLAKVGSPSLMIILRKDRGLEARHGAKTLDPQGRLKYHFQTFVSFNDAHRIIMALWKMRSVGVEQKGEMPEKNSEPKQLPCEEGSLLANEDVKMSEVYSAVLSVDVNALMDMFSGGPLEHKVMQKAGCVDYSPTEWELLNQNTYQRHISFKFDKILSRFGEASTTQRKYNLVNRDGWVIEEVMTLQGVLHEDYSSIQLKYQMTSTSLKPSTCSIQVLLGITWLKGAKQQKKVMKNVMSNSANRLREIFSEVEKELTARKGVS
uniref:C2 and GRAM domain-containing protein n=1 Tax=Leersia perrieri TaxID=77586 RepID=A0A0D9VDF2_9ORYZ